MPVALQGMTAPLTEFYLGPIREQLNNASALMSRLKKSSEYVRGIEMEARIPLNIKRNHGYSWVMENEALPAAGARQKVYTRIPMRFFYHAIELSGQSIIASSSDLHSFVSLLQDEIVGAVQGAKVEVNRELWGDASGSLGSFASTNAVIPAGTLLDLLPDAPATRFEVGMVVDVDTDTTSPTISGTPPNPAGLEISDVDEVGNRIAFNLAIDTTGIAAGTAVHVFVEGSKRRTPTGLRALIDGTTQFTPTLVENVVQGIDRTVAGNRFWHANVIEGGASPTTITMDLDLLQRVVDVAEQRGGGRISAFYSNYPLRRRYLDLAQEQRRYVDELETVRGFQALVYKGGGQPIPWFVDRHCDLRTLYGVDEDFFAIYRATDYNWMNLDGYVLRRVDGKDAYRGILFCYKNLGTTKVNSSVVVRRVV